MMGERRLWKAGAALLPLLPAVLIPGNGTLLSFILVIVGLIIVRSSRAPVLAMLDSGWGRTLLLGVGGGIAIALLGLVFETLLDSLLGWAVDLSNFEGVRGNVRNYLILLAIGILVGGVLEELTFRGFVVGFGTAVLGERAQVWLVLLSAAVFGFAHLYQGWAGVLSTGVTGALIGFLYLYANRKLLVAILAHATINVIGVTLIYLGQA